MRAAMVGGAGYMAGRGLANRAQREAEQDEQIAELQQEPQQVQAEPASSAPDRLDQLSKLKELLDSEVLTQDEFNAEKAKILQGD